MHAFIALLILTSASGVVGQALTCDKYDLPTLMASQIKLTTTADERSKEIYSELQELSTETKQNIANLNITIQKANADTYQSLIRLNSTIITLSNDVDIWKREVNASFQATSQEADNLDIKVGEVNNRTNILNADVDKIVKDLNNLRSEIDKIKGVL